MNFNEAWDFIVKRSQKWCIPVVQNREELKYVFNLMKDCKSYLEVGTAEGNSLFVLANAMPKGSEVTYIDWAEKHTKKPRDEVIAALSDYKVRAVHGDSNLIKTALAAQGVYDAVLIDAGHEDFNAVVDAIYYGPMARKFIIFHDIQIPDVSRAFEWCTQNRPECRMYKVVNSDHYGYGILELP